MRTTKQEARAAGLLYVLIAVIAPVGLLYVPGKLIVSGSASATADNLRAQGSLLRWGMASELLHQVIAVFLVLALYRLFKPVSETLARQLIVFGALLSVPIVFLNVLNDVAALTLVGGAKFLSVFDRPQLDALAYLFVRMHQQGIVVASIFWGIWLFPFGLLVRRSGFIPRWLGLLLFLAGAGYVANATAILIFPQVAPAVDPIASILQIGELPIIVWLAIWGAKPQGSGTGLNAG
ncbi:MAG: DUF4386 domain-containing protein [Thermoanaerobaculia bacterium]